MTKQTWAPLAVAILAMGAPSAHALSLTDLTVFSSNAEGNNWNGLIWNTQGADTDTPAPGRYNLYVTPDPLSDTTPTFVNGYNDARTRIDLALTPGEYTYSLYGEGVGRTFDPAQHFVLNLYFDGIQSSPGISGVQNLTNTLLLAAGHPNGLDIFGNSGHQEAGTLSAVVDGYLVTLTAFSWLTGESRDVVWDYWANHDQYSTGSGRFDYFGSFTVRVESVPEPGTFALLLLGLGGLGLQRRGMSGATRARSHSAVGSRSWVRARYHR